MMTNLNYVSQVIDDLSSDDEFLVMKEETKLSKKDELSLINALIDKAKAFDNEGRFLSYSDWRELFLNAAVIISYDNYNFEGKKMPREKDYVNKAIVLSIRQNLIPGYTPEDSNDNYSRK